MRQTQTGRFQFAFVLSAYWTRFACGLFAKIKKKGGGGGQIELAEC